MEATADVAAGAKEDGAADFELVFQRFFAGEMKARQRRALVGALAERQENALAR